MNRFFLGTLAGISLLGGCATPQISQAQTAIAQPVARCSNGSLSIDTNFPTGALAECEVKSNKQVSITIAPEDAPPINCSAWYAFRITPPKPGKLKVSLKYTACGHRYWPKYSHDGVTWNSFNARDVRIREFSGRKMAEIKIKTDGKPLFIAGQEIIVPATYSAWLSQLEKSPEVSGFMLGKSAQGRDIPGATIGNPNAKEVVVLLGRQHPPEVTGALALFPFVETILADNEEAKAFRQRFQIVLVPMLNPDGVVLGHWRHNTGGKDLNRDWGPFEQPETRLMRDLLEGIDADPARKLRLFLDFHSTQEDVVYTLTKDQVTNPPGLMDAFIADYQARTPGYEVVEKPGHNATSAVSKAWVYERFGVPTATYELGDETDRTLIRKVGKAAAESMMAVLMKSDAPAE